MYLCTSVKYGVLLLWLSVSFIIPLLIFARGLLLHREVLPYRASCADDRFIACYNQSPDDTKLQDCLKFYNGSYTSKQYCSSSDYRVVLIIIDALRYDFVEFDDAVGDTDIPPFINKLTVIRDLLVAEKEHSKLFKFIAHPPTTTMQRINALTTGSLPTFIDIGSNFGSSGINEDNLIDLLTQNKKNAVFLGDDTWCKLYPNRFLRSFPFDSFNVWDLDTVDNGILEHLIPEVRKSDWNLLIAHFLGVDHCGHRYGPFHPEMKRKLNEMNVMLKDIVDEIKLRENVLLFVIGDHGMTTTGDHGGETENEVTTAMFVYSPVHHLHANFLRRTNIISQVDLVPTLSTILGIPIPFSNTGRIALECLPSTLLDSVSVVAFLLWRNVEQITTFIQEYGMQNSQLRASERINLVRSHYSKLRGMWFNIGDENASTFVSECSIYMENVLQMFMEVWTQFNIWLIVGGISCMGLTIVFWILIVSDFAVRGRFCLLETFLPCLFSSFCLLSILIPICWVFFPNAELVAYALVEMCSILIMIRLCLKMYQSLKTAVLNLAHKLTVIDLFAFVVYLCSLLALFANSFIIEEASIMLFFSVSCTWMLVFCSHQFRRPQVVNSQSRTFRIVNFCRMKAVVYAAVISIGFRISLAFLRCREDVYDCKYEDTQKYDVGLCILAVVLIVSYTVFWRKQMGLVILPEWWCLPDVCTALLSVYWINEKIMNLEDFLYINRIPAALLVTCAVMVCYLFYNPLPYQTGRRKDRKSLFMSETDGTSGSDLLRFNSAWNHISVFFCITGCILLGQRYTVPTISMILCSHYFAVLFNAVRKDSSWSAYDVPWNQVILWGFSSTYWFYVTGHHASFSAIEWNAAFLIQDDIGSNMIVPGILVMMNTFISYIVHGLLLTSLLTFRQHSTSLSHSTKTSHKTEIANKNADAFYDGVFALVCKYILSSALRLMVIMSSCTLHSRHLMMWSIFAPKLIFEGIAFVAVTIPSSLIGAAFAARVKYVIGRLSV